MTTPNHDDPDTLGSKLVDALKNAAGSGRTDVEVEHEGRVARARVAGSGPYGSSIDELTVVGDPEVGGEPRDDAIAGQAEQLERKINYLPERIKQHEIAPGLGEGVLRSHPDDMRQREYHEFRLRGGREAEVHRYRYDGDKGEREPIPQNYAHETLERLTDDLAETLAPDDDG